MNQPVIIGNATLYLADCMDVLPTLPKVDSVITDPPYSERTHSGHDASAAGLRGIGFDGSSRRTLGYAAWSVVDVNSLVPALCCASGGWVVVMTDHVLALPIQRAMESAGRYAFAPLPWYVPGSRVRLSGDGPSSWTAWIVVCRTAKQSRWGTLPGGYMQRGEQVHMGGKPIELMFALIGDYSMIGDTILDPFMGSGSTGVAAMQLGRKFIGIEIEPRYFEVACRRIEDAQRQAPLIPHEQPRQTQEALL